MSQSHNISIDAAQLQNESTALMREWIVTNGIGGYASSTLAGANTRRYHGLLVAALNPPVGRAVLLSKLEESIEIVGEDGSRSPSYTLATNNYPGVTFPQGYEHLESWNSLPCPTTVWMPASGVCFEKRVWMAHGKNTVYISYRLLEAPAGASAHLHVVPLIAWKDYHSEMQSTDDTPHSDWYSPAQVVSREPDAPVGVLRVFLRHINNLDSAPQILDIGVTDLNGSPTVDAMFAGQPYWNYNMVHAREQERGLDCREDLFTPGMISAPLRVGESIVITATVYKSNHSSSDERPPSPTDALAATTKRQEQIIACLGSESAFARKLAFAADQFMVQAPGGRSTIIAGYHWFGDWGRDTMISLGGVCLPTGRADAARDILVSYSKFVDQGMLPNRFPDGGSAPEYNTVDATLWYFVSIYRYYKATGDLATVRDELWPVLETIIQAHQHGTRYGIHVDTDSLLYAGAPGVQLTWMDAKIGDWVVTARTGKPVEINALWQNALRTMAEFARLLDRSEAADRYNLLAQTHAGIFNARYPRSDGVGLYDVLDTPPRGVPDEAVRPNQIFAVSLPFPVLEPKSEIARKVVSVVQEQLLTPFGVRTLSPKDPAYRSRYVGSPGDRDSAYHQGTAWPWLLGAFAEAHFKVFSNRDETMSLLTGMEAQMSQICMGSIAEVYDGGETSTGSAEQKAGGCIAQAWSVGEILRVWMDLERTRRKT
jgi:predicted glycogen debranching enzyme